MGESRLSTAEQHRVLKELEPRAKDLAKQVVKQYGGDVEELFRHGRVRLWEVICSFNPECGKEVTAVWYNAVRWRMLDMVVLEGRAHTWKIALKVSFSSHADSIDLGDMFNETQKHRIEWTVGIIAATRATAMLTPSMVSEDEQMRKEAWWDKRDAMVRSALDILQPKIRELFLRTELGGEKINAVAAELGIKDAYHKLERAKKKLGSALGGPRLSSKLFGDEDDDDDGGGDQGGGTGGGKR